MRGLGFSALGLTAVGCTSCFGLDPERARVTESQNHRMYGVGRDLCGSSRPTPLLKQGPVCGFSWGEIWGMRGDEREGGESGQREREP